MKGKPQNRLQDVSADEIGRLIQAVAVEHAEWDFALYILPGVSSQRK